ncbi:LamG domain-containing protein [Amycolatopsis balhimycina DSM 5908]|uniref:LamG domain-containing protein n=1 Tax=Amycolatopsis balhimycina DSM 5908 TaxID=1081091 RepID=A0A428WKJ5_AMYBA|nr:LamG domain-containing protein [Amycolatopsis balhimycina]RSM43597.1 LamG domain-containing protein [Amycolatopsis balhimycina DSM 5908]
MFEAARGKDPAGHRPWRRALALLAVLLVAGTALSVHRTPAPLAAAPVAAAPDEASAANAAYHQGSRVEVAGRRTETRTTYANPDGTMTAELSAVPVRVKRGTGWAPVDTRLVKGADGAVRPVAAEGDLALSGGGSVAPLAELTRDGKRLALRWPGTLPVPEVDGDAATYRELLPGVDLVMRAGRDGYRQQFVVKNTDAAGNLAKIALRLETTGVTVKSGGAGSLHASDDKGKEIFSAPPAVMWDGAGARSTVGVELGAQTLTLVPDRKFFLDKATVYPVVVDPDWHTFGWTTWNTVLSGKPGTAYPRTSGDGQWAQVGACYTASGGCNGIGIARSYFQYDTGFLNGRRVIGAWLNSTVVHSPSCNDRWHQLFMATGTIDDGTTWNNAPQGWKVSDVVAPSVYGSSCGGYKGIGFPATGAVNQSGVSTYFLKASDEGDQLAWRKYSPGDTLLVVNYNTRPDPASDLATDPPLKAPCRWCDGKPYVGDDFIRFSARLTDPDGNAVKPWWHIYTDSAREERWGGLQASGAYHSTDIDLRNKDGHTMTLWVQPYDTYDNGDNADAGDWRQGPGPFVVDGTRVTVPPTVTGVLYQEDNRWHGGTGIPGTFTFGANGVTDIDHYVYSWGSGPQTQVDANALGGTATVSTAPDGDGPRDLNVWSFDRGGHPSPVRTFHVYVKPGNGPLAQWSFEGNLKDDANLGWRDGSAVGNPVYAPGAVGSAIKLDGTQQVTAPNTVQATESFSVAAWVKLDAADAGSHRVITQWGTTTCSFCLQYEGNTGKWVFVMPQTDSASPPGYNFVRSVQPAAAGVWTHLAASYDAVGHKVRLYVNGVPAGSAAAPSSWQGSDLLRIGTGFPGRIDEVRAYDRLVSDAEVLAMVTGDNVQTGQWRFEDKNGTKAANSVPGGESATLSGDAAFTQNGAVGGGLVTGGTGYAATSGPMLRTDQSFSVAAWVNPKIAQPVDGGFYAAASQDGAVNSGFLLGYRPLATGNKWEVYLPSADALTRPGDDAVRVDAPANPMDTWTHLAAVYDDQAKEIRIYVNGRLAGTAPRTAGFNATGPFTIGRGKMTGNFGHNWEGTLDEVRAYGRVLTAGEVQAMVARDDVTQGSWKFDGDATDDSGRGRNGTITPTQPFTAGQANAPDQADLAVDLDGADDFVKAPAGPDTSQSFSVSAWVKLDAQPAGWTAVASQNGDHTSAFWLGYSGKDDNHWAFSMHGPDADSPDAVRLRSTEAAQPGVWTHLAAVYDKAAGTMSLYVNGVPSVTGRYTAANWNARGEFDVGRAKWASAWTNYLPGAVDDVKLYGRALFAGEVRTQAGRDLALVHDWRFDEPSGSNAGDAVGARGAAYTGGVSLIPGRVGNAVHVDGTGSLTTTGVDLRTDESFSVSTWVRMGKPDCDLSQVPECKRVVLSVDGDHASKFRLGYVKDTLDNQAGKWTFEMPESDADHATITKAAVSVEGADQDHWVHLVGVYDQPAKKIWLYVNGTRIGDGTLNSRWNATGGAAIGRGKIDGNTAKQNWIGDIDDTRVYTGALDKDRISALLKSYPPEEGNAPAKLPAADLGYWTFDENTGATVGDTSGKGHNATLKGGYSWIAGGRKGPSSLLDGTSGYAETAAPVLTGGSFSVAAWVNLTEGKNGDRTIVAQDGSRVSSFMLQYNAAADKWGVRVPLADQDNAATVTLTSTVAAMWTDWMHVAMSYDDQLHQVRLYLNGVLQAAQSNVKITPGTGPLTIGRAKWNGVNAQFFPRAIDDVRVFGHALSAAEMAKVREDTYVPNAGRWPYDDGTARDVTWRQDDVTLTGGASYVPGVSGKALQLDGTGHGTAKWIVHNMQDSLTVSSWARLGRGDKVATIAAQDGVRQSGFALQYRPELKRWIFGAAQSDTDAAPMVYAVASQETVLNIWTHVTGVYDNIRHQLRVYVDGKLAGTRDNVTLWRAAGAFSLGRDKLSGQSADFFTGALDETNVETGALDDAAIARRASYPVAQPGQLGRFANGYVERVSANTSAPSPAGYHFEQPLGLLVSGDQPNTRSLYSCKDGYDGFTSADAACEGKTVVGEIGKVYTKQPSNLPTVAVYRCNAGGSEHFDSRDAACENAGTKEGLLGYTLAYGLLVRYMTDLGYDHVNTTYGPPPGYWTEGPQGVLPMLAQSGTVPLLSCTTGTDQFLSTDAACEGKTTERVLGQIFTAAPPDGAGTALYRCKAGGTELFTTTYADCNGATFDRQLGYVLTTAPTTTPVFPAA